VSDHPPQPEVDPDATMIRSLDPVAPSHTPRPARAAGGRPRSGGRRIVAAVVGTVVVLIGGAYLVGYLMAGDKLPKNAQVAGVAVGGLSRSGAVEKLETDLGSRTSAPIPVVAGGKDAQLDPAEAGLRIDYARSVAAAGGGRSLNPAQILRVLTGGSATDAVLVVDQVKLRGTVQGLADRVDQPPIDATLAYDGARIKQTKAEDGLVLQQDAAATALQDRFLLPRTPVLELPVQTSEPEVTSAEVDEVVASFAEPAVSAPVRVVAGSAGSFEVSPTMIGNAVTFAAQDGTLVPRLDAAKLRRNAAAVVKGVELTKPKDATVRIVDGNPKVIAAADGTTVDAANLAKAVEPALTKSGDDRRADVELTGADADFSTADAEKLGIREVTGEFTTYFPYATYRNVNIGRAAELINGTVLKPGETFSLNGIVGERTKANGFTEGFIISGGRFRKELGGGVSQSATTTYNAMFFAGLKDVEHRPHTLYINRYPPGREATVAWPNLDLKFQNDTKHGVLVQASVDKATSSRRGSITVKMWSTKTYDRVVATETVKSNFTSGRNLEDDSATCEPTSPVQGFDADYQRVFYRDGDVVRRQSFSWHYGPTDQVTCT